MPAALERPSIALIVKLSESYRGVASPCVLEVTPGELCSKVVQKLPRSQESAHTRPIVGNILLIWAGIGPSSATCGVEFGPDGPMLCLVRHKLARNRPVLAELIEVCAVVGVVACLSYRDAFGDPCFAARTHGDVFQMVLVVEACALVRRPKGLSEKRRDRATP